MTRNRKRVQPRAIRLLWERIEVTFGKPLSSGNVYDKNRMTYQEIGEYSDLIESVKGFLATYNKGDSQSRKKRSQIGKSILYEGIYSKLRDGQAVLLTEETANLLCKYAGYKDIDEFINIEGLGSGFFASSPPPPATLSVDSTKPFEDHQRGFTSILTIKDVDFVGRKFLVKEIDNYLVEASNGYFVIQGDPGIGKTSFLIDFILDRGYPHHLNIRAEGISSAEQFYYQICGQLLSKYYSYKEIKNLYWTPTAAYFKQLVASLARNTTPVVIVIDALDEAAKPSKPGENPLLLPQFLPKGVFIIVTSRRIQKPILTAPDTEMYNFILDADSVENLTDVKQFIERKSRSSAIKAYMQKYGLKESQFQKLLQESSEGNFMYLKYVFNDLEKGRLGKTQTLPTGLNQYYEGHWNLMAETLKRDWEVVGVPVLAAMASSNKAMTVSDILTITSHVEKSNVKRFLNNWKQFFRISGLRDDRTYRVYHSSFSDFLNSKEEILDKIQS